MPARYLERWGMDIRNNLELTHFVTLRQPLVAPPAEARSFADLLFDIGRRLAPEQAQYFAFGTHEDFVRIPCSKLPTTGPDDRQFKDGFEYMKHYGVFVDQSEPKPYAVFQKRLNDRQLAGSRVAASGVVYRANDKGKESAVGLQVDGRAVCGFATPSRKFEVPVSNSLGGISGGRASEGKNGRRVAVAARGISADAAKGFGPAPAHDDLDAGVWWDKKNGGRGNGVNINALLPINPQPLVGMQAWFDTVCSLRKV